MPTGYTSYIEEKDISFDQFVWLCARAFGAFVLERDNAMTDPLPMEYRPSPWAERNLERCRAELERLSAMTQAELAAEADLFNQRSREEYRCMNEERASRRPRLEAMLRKVESWEPPSPDHKGLKDFMAQQLMDTIDHDCDQFDAPEPITTVDLIERAKSSFERASKSWADEQSRTAERNKWIAGLRNSVPYAPIDAESAR